MRTIKQKDTEYYKSGQHSKNVALARKASAIASRRYRLERIEVYNKNPNVCANCDKPLVYDKKIINFVVNPVLHSLIIRCESVRWRH